MNKQDFPIFTNHPELVYLDSAATSQKPAKVIDATSEYYQTTNSNIHRGIYKLSEDSSIMFENARAKVATFINAQSQEIVFTSGTTQSLNMLSQMLIKTLKPGDEIVISIMEHHSNYICWQQIAKQKGAILRIIPITKGYELNLTVATQIINPKTKIVAITHMSNVLGTINPVKELSAIAHKFGAIVVVDAAQSIAHQKIDVKELGCDFLAFSAHKMCGPTGIGVLYGKDELLQKLYPVNFGGGMVQSVDSSNSTWKNSPYKFEAGTPPIAQAKGLASAIDYLERIGLDYISIHTANLTKYALDSLDSIPQVTIIGPSEFHNRGPVISFTLEGIHPHDVAQILSDNHICARAGTHCAIPLMQQINLPGTTRISLYLYNTKEDIDKLIIGLNKTIEVFK
jgi:cysteine desulfurase / selenocysteine lyase